MKANKENDMKDTILMMRMRLVEYIISYDLDKLVSSQSDQTLWII